MSSSTRTRLPLVLSITALVVAIGGTALAAPSASDPLRVVLQKADFPAGVEVSPTRNPPYALSAYGIKRLTGASTWVSVPAGGSVKTSLGDFPKTWRVEADVLVSPDKSGAQRIFRLDSAGGGALGAPASAKVELPSFGDEQVAFVWSGAQGTQGWIVVRKQNVVWHLRVANAPLQWRNVTKAQVLAQLKSYAAKQARRTGRGA